MNRIKDILETKGISQRELAEMLGKSYNMVNAYVQNRQQPRLEVLFEIAKLLDVDAKELLSESAVFSKKRLTFIDLFAGCGGLSEGFLETGEYEALAHVEWELPMVNTLRARLKTRWQHNEDDALKRVVHFDIQKTDELIRGNWQAESIKKYGKSNHPIIIETGLKGIVGNRKVDLIIGGPPCQAYSIAGRAQDKDSMRFDYRNYLFESFVSVVSEFKPEIFVFENVPGILSAKPGDQPVTKRIYAAFQKAGYTVLVPEKLKNAVYSAYDFGVPQRRNRVIIIGVRNNSEYRPEDIYRSIDVFKDEKSKKTVLDSIGKLPAYWPLEKPRKENGRNISHFCETLIPPRHHDARYHNERDISVFRHWIINEMNKKSNEEKINFYNKLLGKNSNHAKYRNLEWDKPSPTIVAHLYKDGLMFIHPDEQQARSITVKEAALLQSFPDDFEFRGSQGDCFKMIGNAVPPEMAKGIACGIVKSLKNYEQEKEDAYSRSM